MRLHLTNDFQDLIALTSDWKNIPETAVRRDYFMVLSLNNLMDSQFIDRVVFKGGTSISKCYPGVIERFSEDIDLTYLPKEYEGINHIDRTLKSIEQVLAQGLSIEKINKERSPKNKSSFVWYKVKENQVKLEIGSSVRPHPYHKMKLRTYIEEYLAYKGYYNAINEYGLHEVHLNVLDITRTFIDKLMAIKRHALCGTLQNKVRHIYDIVKMFESKEITDFLQDKKQLKMILKLTKETDSYYLVKRDLPKEYNPLGSYDFERWKHKLDKKIKNRYETLHLDLLYTEQKQDFALAKSILKKVNTVFLAIDE